MNIRLTQRANRDLHQISKYFTERDPVVASAIFTSLDRIFSHLQTMPLLGRATDIQSVRCIVVPRYPYKVFYRLTADTIEVLTIFHTSQDPKKGW